MDIAGIIAAALERKGWTKAEAARRFGVTRQTVGDWVKGRSVPSRRHAPRVAKSLGIPLSAISADPSHANVALADSAVHDGSHVPLIDWVDAGRGAQAVDPYPVGGSDELVGVSVSVSSGSFALTVKGNSMEPEFREGEKIVVDPAVEPISGDFVVVELLTDGKVPGEGDIVFKQYRTRGSEAFDLVPLNADYPTVTVNAGNPGRIIGKVVEHHRILIRS